MPYIRLLAVASAAALAFASFGASATTLDVTKFGADPTGARPTQAEIYKAVAAAKSGDVVFFPKGTYALEKFIWIGEKKNVVLRGEKGAVIRMHCNPRGAENEASGAFYFYHCEDVALENFVVTTDNPIGCVGRVVAVDAAAHTLDFEIAEPFPATGEEHFSQLNTYDEEGSPDAALEVHAPIKPRKAADGTTRHVGLDYKMIGGRVARIDVPKWASLAAVTNGHRLLVRYFRNGEGPVVLNGVKRGRIEDVEIERTPSTGCMIVPPSEDLVFRRFSIRPRAGDPNVCASNSDGIHFVGCAGSVTLEDCHFKGLGDDALNVHSLGGEVKSFDAATGAFEFIRRSTDRKEQTLSAGWASAGDSIAVYDPETLGLRGRLTLASFEKGRGKARPGGLVPRVGDLLANERNYPVVRISGCSVENTRARAFLLQTRKLTLENCRFRGLKSAAVILACDMVFWHEMGPFEDAVVRNCTFEKCARRFNGEHLLGALVVRAKHDGGPADYPAGVHRNLRVEGNSFSDIGTSAVYVEATDGLEIRGNRFARCATDPNPPAETRYPVRLRNCVRATVEDNAFDGDAAKVVLERKFLPPKGTKDARRPYEMVWANRRADEVPPVDRLESAEGWIAAGEHAVASVTNADDRLLFGDGTLRLDYAAVGDSPRVRLRREVPLKLAAFDTFSVWIYGNNFYGKSPAGTPMTRLFADFTDADGQTFSLDVATILHREWCKFQVKVPAHLRARTMKGGCTFDGFTLTGGTNKESRRLDFTSVCAFVEELKPLSFKPRAKRGVQVFKDEPQGINTGDGRLPFPTVETTVVPPASAVDAALEFRTPAKPGVWDDLAFRVGKKGPWIPLAIGGGVWPRSAADKAEVRWHRIGNSLVADVVVKGGDVEELRFGGLGVEPDAKSLPIPFYTYGSQVWDERPQVVVVEGEAGARFVSATLDWTQSNASLPFPPESGSELVQANGGARYRPKTDGARNDVYERFVWTVSPKFEETLPFIPNPVSPWRAVTGRAAWTTSGANGDRTPNYEDFFWKRRAGLRRLTVTDHETGWRDGDESFTFRTDPAPGRGGYQGQYDYARKMIDGFGFRYGPYNNYTDYAPVNGYWHSDFVSRKEDGNWQSAWSRCTGPKPLYAVEMCEKLAPVIQSKFNFNTAYCDVHTAVSPWSRTDYDARVPGAGTFAQTFYAYGEIMLIQKRTWGGPVESEGGHQWLYSGLTDQNYGQDRTYQLMKHPWIVDFDLLRMHPLTSDYGCFAGMIFGDANVPKGSPWRVVEPWTAVTLAFGHSAFLLPENPIYSYYMTLAPASRYSQENVKTIRYADAKGRLLTTSKAVANGEIARNRVVVAYDGGTLVVVNGDPEGGWLSVRRGEGRLALPQWGFFCRGGETVAYSGWAKDGTNRVDFCRGGREDGYVFLHGRGVLTEFPGGATDGWLARLAEAGGTEEIIPERKEGEAEIGLPYAATRLVGLRAKSNAEVVKEIPFRIDEKGWTRFKRDPDCYSYRATLPAGWTEPSADVYEAWCLRSRDFKAPAVASSRVAEPQTLPKRFRRGVLLPNGTETALEESSGGRAHLGGTTCGGKSQQGLLVHPPYQDGAKGAVFACYVLTPNEKGSRFRADVGKGDGSTPGDGILFKVGVRVGTGPIKVLAEKRVTEHRWEPVEADLSLFVGQRIRLYLIADPGGNTYGDGGAWANMRLCR